MRDSPQNTDQYLSKVSRSWKTRNDWETVTDWKRLGDTTTKCNVQSWNELGTARRHGKKKIGEIWIKSLVNGIVPMLIWFW